MNVSMKKNNVLLHLYIVIFSLLLTSPIHAKTINVGQIKLKETIKLGKTNLLLNGAGQRSKYFIDLYVAALYVQNKSQDAKTIIDSDEPMLIQIHVISNLITSENLTKGTMEGFKKSTNNKTEAIQTDIDKFLSSFKESIKIGDIFEIVYLPNKGITVIKNRKIVNSLSTDLDFKRALFGIWLSDNPAQESLKKALLGR